MHFDKILQQIQGPLVAVGLFTLFMFSASAPADAVKWTTTILLACYTCLFIAERWGEQINHFLNGGRDVTTTTADAAIGPEPEGSAASSQACSDQPSGSDGGHG